MIVAFAVLTAIFAAPAILWLAFGRGRPVPFRDATGALLEGSLSEKTFITVNGTRQGMFLKSKDVRNPVLLYLHGGMPESFLAYHHPTGLEERFTVAWWDQRGSGLSYPAGKSKEKPTVSLMVSDVLEVTGYLCRRFGKEKIWLMAHSGGTFVGIHAAKAAPELFHGYIGVSQMVHQLRSEILAYDEMLRRYREAGIYRMVRKLEKAPVTMAGGVPKAYLAVRDEAMHGLGVGTMREMRSVLKGIILPSLRYPEYSWREKVHLWAGKSRSGVSSLWDEMLRTNLAESLQSLHLPVYFFHGIYDQTCSFRLAEAYFDRLKAPVKKFYAFEASAHSPMFEEPEKMMKIITREILK